MVFITAILSVSVFCGLLQFGPVNIICILICAFTGIDSILWFMLLKNIFRPSEEIFILTAEPKCETTVSLSISRKVVYGLKQNNC